MEEKDYKAISEIIRINIGGMKDWKRIQKLTNDLANYFERESSCITKGNYKTHNNFNRKQFLKDCGIDT